MVGWYHQLDGHEFEQAPGVGDGQGSLTCCSPWGCKETTDTTERLNSTDTEQLHNLSSLGFLMNKEQGTVNAQVVGSDHKMCHIASTQ